jgi:hypothetical protein
MGQIKENEAEKWSNPLKKAPKKEAAAGNVVE